MTTLDHLAPGQSAIIELIGGDPAVVQRLGEFGVFEGERVEVVGTAPLGDPMEIRVGQTHLSLRKSEAAGVKVSTK
jgi:ferrous iron transport protein A